MITVELESLYAMVTSPVMPECMKVESPMTATVCPSLGASVKDDALLKPWMPDTDAPMHMVVSIALRGSMAPRV